MTPGVVSDGGVEDQRLQRQMGCMAGLLHLFDRGLIGGRRSYSVRSLPVAPVRLELESVFGVFFFVWLRFSDRRMNNCRRMGRLRRHCRSSRRAIFHRLHRRFLALPPRRGASRGRLLRGCLFPCRSRPSRALTKGRPHGGRSATLRGSLSIAARWLIPRGRSVRERSVRLCRSTPGANLTPPKRGRNRGGPQASSRD